MKKAFLFVFAAAIGANALADLPFRNHRYDSFKALKGNKEQIIFLGNSITNMHEWCEAFACHDIVNRGVSGAVSQEVKENVAQIVKGKPKKLFLNIGTNDIGSDFALDVPVNNIDTIFSIIKKISPKTQIYFQSIIPSNNGKRTLEKIEQTNEKIKVVCAKHNVTYIDIYTPLLPIVSDEEFSLDRLHLSCKAYKVWCEILEPHVGKKCVYPDNGLSIYGNQPYSLGMRISSLAAAPRSSDDVLILGDELVSSGEWHELLNSPKVKNRGSGWGIFGPSIKVHSALIGEILTGEIKPKTIVLYTGTAELNEGSSAENALLNAKDFYNLLVARIRGLAPNTKIYLMSIAPQNNAEINAQRIAPFNAWLKQIATDTKNVDFIDIYTPLYDKKTGVHNAKLMKENYPYACGYKTIANVLKKALKNDLK